MNLKTVKLLAMICAVVFVLASCENTGTGTSDPSGVSSPETSVDSVFTDGSFVQPTYPIDAILGSEPDRTGEKILLSMGKPYTKSFASDTENYPDTNDAELTDGKTGSLGFVPEWTGFALKSAEDLEIVIDLGAVTEGIADIELRFLSWIDCGITLPGSVVFSVSSDGEEYRTLGTVFNFDEESGVFSKTFSLKLGRSVRARYIKAFIPKKVWWMFMDEFSVYSYGESSGETDTYGKLAATLFDTALPEKVTTRELWSESEPDYNDEINLARGLAQRVYVPLPLTDRYSTSYGNSPKTSTVLTDGVRESSPWSGEWFKSVHGIERNLVFDLGKLSAVSSVSVGYGQSEGAGIYAPRLIEIYLSENGADWEKVFERDKIESFDGVNTALCEFGASYSARFVCIKLGISCFVYLDEIEIKGTKAITDSCRTLNAKGTFDSVFPGEYNKDSYGGVSHMLLAPFTTDASKVTAEVTAEHWLPYVAYVDENGEIKDTMFDSVMLSPYGTTFAGGHTPQSLSNYIQSMFSANANLDALNSTVAEVASKLGKNDMKMTVVIAIPSLNRDFVNGDYNGDGMDENLTTFEGLKAVTDMFTDAVESGFAKANYSHLVLKGYYWSMEGIEYQKPFEEELIEYTSSLCHEKGFELSWIPWNNASGYQEWEKLGFDVACMQPNYTFYDMPVQVIDEIADETKLLGMSVEIEIHPSALSDEKYFNMYMEYLKGGIRKGYMNAMNFYYQGGTPGEFYRAAEGEGAYGRMIYDYTYAYIKGTLKSAMPSAEGQTVCIYKGENAEGALGKSDDKTEYVLCASPSYGSVSVGKDGSFKYSCPKDFVGDDFFTFNVSNGFGKAENVRVTVKVREKSDTSEEISG